MTVAAFALLGVGAGAGHAALLWGSLRRGALRAAGLGWRLGLVAAALVASALAGALPAAALGWGVGFGGAALAILGGARP